MKKEKKKISVAGSGIILLLAAFFVFGLIFFTVPYTLSQKYGDSEYVILEGTFEYSAYDSEGVYKDVYKVIVGNEEKLVNVQSDGEKKDATYTMKFKYNPEEEKFYDYNPDEKDNSGIQFSAFGAMFLLIGIVMVLGFTGGVNDQLFFGLMFIIFGGTGIVVLMIENDYSSMPLMLFWVILGLIIAIVPSVVPNKKKEDVNNGKC